MEKFWASGDHATRLCTCSELMGGEQHLTWIIGAKPHVSVEEEMANKKIDYLKDNV